MVAYGTSVSLASRLVWSPDGSLLATYANDSLVKLWDTEEWRLVHSLENETNSTINSLSPIDIAVFSPDGRHIAVAQPSSLRVWDTGDRPAIGPLAPLSGIYLQTPFRIHH